MEKMSGGCEYYIYTTPDDIETYKLSNDVKNHSQNYETELG